MSRPGEFLVERESEETRSRFMFEHGTVEVQWGKFGRFDVVLGEECSVRLGSANRQPVSVAEVLS